MADVATTLQEATDKMNKAVEVAKDDFGAIRTGRAHPAMFNKIMVDYYGTFTALIRVNFPQLTEERRKDYIKVAKTKAEDSKISMRNIRRTAKEAMEKAEKDGDISKDDLSRGEKELEKITSEHVLKIDELLKHKEAELLEV